MKNSRMHIKCWLNGRLKNTTALAVPDVVQCCRECVQEQRELNVGHDGYMNLIHRNFGQGRSIHFWKLLNVHGMSDLIPVHLKKEALNFYLNREV